MKLNNPSFLNQVVANDRQLKRRPISGSWCFGQEGRRRLLLRTLGQVFLIVVFLVGIGCDFGFTDSSEPTSQMVGQRWARPQIGDLAISFSLGDSQGNIISLSDYKGKVVLLNFWATWCGPCRVEMPNMEATYRNLKHKGFEIVAISNDPEGVTVTKPFVEAYGLSFAILHDLDYRVSASYGVRTLPMSYLVDRKGIIRHQIFGARDWKSPEAEKLIHLLLNEGAVRYD